MKTYTRKYSWGKLAIRADFAQSTSQIRYATDQDIVEGVWSSTPYQVASFAHQSGRALYGVNRWLKTQQHEACPHLPPLP